MDSGNVGIGFLRRDFSSCIWRWTPLRNQLVRWVVCLGYKSWNESFKEETKAQ